MKTATSCATSACETRAAEQPRYYARQIITADDLSLDQEYARRQRRLHNRMLHGWGVVCGAMVCPAPLKDKAGPSGYAPWKVTVCPGYILGPCGDEIYIDCCRTVDLRTTGVSGVTGDPCIDPPDPWCSDAIVARPTAEPFYVAVKYKQVMARPVRVQPMGCGCDDSRCEFSRWRDGFEIGILRRCPDSHQDPPFLDASNLPNLNLLVTGEMTGCPTVPPDPWVVLAEVKVDENGVITAIDNCHCRRSVISYGNFWWRCQSSTITIGALELIAPPGIDLDALEQDPDTVIQVAVAVGGPLAQPPASAVDLGPGIAIRNVALAAGKLKIDFVVDEHARSGPRTLTVRNVDCAVARKPAAITVA